MIHLAKEMRKLHLNKNQLTKEEIRMIEKYFGFRITEPMLYSEIGKEMFITKQRVMQIIKVLFEKLNLK